MQLLSNNIIAFSFMVLLIMSCGDGQNGNITDVAKNLDGGNRADSYDTVSLPDHFKDYFEFLEVKHTVSDSVTDSTTNKLKITVGLNSQTPSCQAWDLVLKVLKLDGTEIIQLNEWNLADCYKPSLTYTFITQSDQVEAVHLQLFFNQQLQDESTTKPKLPGTMFGGSGTDPVLFD